ncbi:unnamed protein product [Adineta steineri]|uniref:Uncharacterized protein n=1 Tax=Adineta steineri TaxID=433720 RepID=A0A815AQ23_9BILA|nr:unnamed protein product [Adineta steineri]CAF3689654.1 unnamed protein product [Adineta steineri]
MTLTEYAQKQRLNHQVYNMYQCITSPINKIDSLFSMTECIQQKSLYYERSNIDQTGLSILAKQDNLSQCEHITTLPNNKHERSHMTLAEYAERRRLRYELNKTDQSIIEQPYSLIKRQELTILTDNTHKQRKQCDSRLRKRNQQCNSSRLQSFIALSDDQHQDDFVTIDRNIQVKALHPKWFEMDEYISLSTEQKNNLHRYLQIATLSTHKYEIRAIRMIEYMKQKLFDRKTLGIHKFMPTSTGQQENKPFIISSINKSQKPFVPLTEYAQFRRRQYKQCKTKVSSIEQSTALFFDKHQDEFVTLARYLELKGLDPESFEMDESVSEQDNLLENSQNILLPNNKHDIQIIETVDCIRQTRSCQNLLEKYELDRIKSQHSQQMNTLELFNRNNVCVSLSESNVEQFISINVLNAKQYVVTDNQYRFDNNTRKSNHRIWRIFARSPPIISSQKRAKNSFLTRIRRNILICFCQGDRPKIS